MTEEQLIQGCIENDRRCQNALYKKYFPLITSLALRYCNNESEIMVKTNGGFLKVLLNIKKYDNQYALATWIRNIMVHHFIDEFRKEKKYIANIHVVEPGETDFSSVQNDGLSELKEKDLLNLLAKLPDVTRAVFNMYAIEGYKHKEIADFLKISEGTSKWHVSDGRKKLREMIEKQIQMEEQRIELIR